MDEAAEAERLAGIKLNLAKALLDGKHTERAQERLRELLQTYPHTKAAAEAKAFLDQLP